MLIRLVILAVGALAGAVSSSLLQNQCSRWWPAAESPQPREAAMLRYRARRKPRIQGPAELTATEPYLA
jgi:hypothetical protein